MVSSLKKAILAPHDLFFLEAAALDFHTLLSFIAINSHQVLILNVFPSYGFLQGSEMKLESDGGE